MRKVRCARAPLFGTLARALLIFQVVCFSAVILALKSLQDRLLGLCQWRGGHNADVGDDDGLGGYWR
ncbi:MAG: hypothetical protein VB948_17330 [Pseudomonadales bacterium]